jgi:aminoglycoside phosphotransferase (APT) family kinase protein
MQQSGAMLSSAEQALGRSLRFEGRTARGESASTFVVTSGESTFVLKVREAGPGVLDNQHRLARLIESLRSRGFPAPAVRGVGEAAGLVFVLQEFVGGEPLEPAPGHPPAPRTLHAVLPSLLESILLQRDGGDPSVPPWPGWLLETLEHGGDGYCLHETMRQRTETSRLLDSLQSQLTAVRGIPVRTTDIVHFDLNPANVLHQHGRLTGVVDWNVPFTGAMQGDRGFDVATLLFYYYDVDAAQRELLWQRCISYPAPPGPPSTSAT